jgi:acid phosphatase (class A)
MVAEVFGEAMDILITKEQTPAIWALLDTVLLKSSETVDRLKEIRFRKRPFVQLSEPSFVPGDEEKERGKSSFPSGHTSLGWSEALVMAEVAPEKQDTILRRGYEYGENRMIVGYHWFTDIEATRQLASAFIANMHAGEGFCEMIRRARAAYLEQTTAVQGVRRTDSGDGRSYRLNGAPATEATRGLVIRDGQKIVR